MTSREHQEIHDVQQTKKMLPLITRETLNGFGFLRSKFILSNNKSRAPRWVLETCLTVELLPLMMILIIASLSSKTHKHRTESRESRVRQDMINVIRTDLSCWIATSIRFWVHMLGFGCSRLPCTKYSFFFGLIWRGMKYFYDQIPKIESGNSTHPQTCIEKDNFQLPSNCVKLTVVS